MCTAVTYKNRYFGRNLDYDCSFGESVVITPREFPFAFPDGRVMEKHHALIGMAHVSENYPLYYDAMNEKGLVMAGLLFAGNAVYQKPAVFRDNIPSWALIPWVLGQCETVAEAKKLLETTNLTDTPFSEALPPTPLHWMIADQKEAITVEWTAEGRKIYENPVGVLTNNPPFPFHLQNLCQYLNLTAEQAENRFSEKIPLHSFSRGMGAIGLPGDWSSASRFVRGAFVRLHAVSAPAEDIGQVFHILSSVEQPMGCVRLGENTYERTLYSSCFDFVEGSYYCRTYQGYEIRAVEFSEERRCGEKLWKLALE